MADGSDYALYENSVEAVKATGFQMPTETQERIDAVLSQHAKSIVGIPFDQLTDLQRAKFNAAEIMVRLNQDDAPSSRFRKIRLSCEQDHINDMHARMMNAFQEKVNNGDYSSDSDAVFSTSKKDLTHTLRILDGEPELMAELQKDEAAFNQFLFEANEPNSRGKKSRVIQKVKSAVQNVRQQKIKEMEPVNEFINAHFQNIYSQSSENVMDVIGKVQEFLAENHDRAALNDFVTSTQSEYGLEVIAPEDDVNDMSQTREVLMAPINAFINTHLQNIYAQSPKQVNEVIDRVSFFIAQDPSDETIEKFVANIKSDYELDGQKVVKVAPLKLTDAQRIADDEPTDAVEELLATARAVAEADQITGVPVYSEEEPKAEIDLDTIKMPKVARGTADIQSESEGGELAQKSAEMKEKHGIGIPSFLLRSAVLDNVDNKVQRPVLGAPMRTIPTGPVSQVLEGENREAQAKPKIGFVERLKSAVSKPALAVAAGVAAVLIVGATMLSNGQNNDVAVQADIDAPAPIVAASTGFDLAPLSDAIVGLAQPLPASPSGADAMTQSPTMDSPSTAFDYPTVSETVSLPLTENNIFAEIEPATETIEIIEEVVVEVAQTVDLPITSSAMTDLELSMLVSNLDKAQEAADLQYIAEMNAAEDVRIEAEKAAETQQEIVSFRHSPQTALTFNVVASETAGGGGLPAIEYSNVMEQVEGLYGGLGLDVPDDMREKAENLDKMINRARGVHIDSETVEIAGHDMTLSMGHSKTMNRSELNAMGWKAQMLAKTVLSDFGQEGFEVAAAIQKSSMDSVTGSSASFEMVKQDYAAVKVAVDTGQGWAAQHFKTSSDPQIAAAIKAMQERELNPADGISVRFGNEIAESAKAKPLTPKS